MQRTVNESLNDIQTTGMVESLISSNGGGNLRAKVLAVAIAATLSVTSFSVAAAPNDSEIDQLKAQLAELQSKVNSLEQHNNEQAPSAASAGTDQRLTAVEKAINNTTLSGKMYFDLTNTDQKNSDTGKTSNSGTGFDVKRFYLSVDHKFTDIWSANLTTDFNYVSNDGQTNLFVKKAYVQGKFDQAAVLRVGASDMPWIPFVEHYYGYRYVENTLTDRLHFGNSADWGVHMAGDVGESKMFNYAVSAVNGGGYKNPSRSKNMDFAGRIGFKPMKNMIVALGAYSGHLGKQSQTTGATNTAERQDVMVAYADENFRLGGEYFTAKNWNNVVSTKQDKADGYSFWGSVAVAKNVNLFARYDNANLSKTLDSNAKDKYYNLGVEYQMTKGFKVAAVWKHEDKDQSVSSPTPAHIQTVKTDEVGVWGEAKF
ncbi:MAG: porin [Sulfuriferula sp.]